MNNTFLQRGMYNHLCIDVKTENKFPKPIYIEQLFMYGVCVVTCVVKCLFWVSYVPTIYLKMKGCLTYYTCVVKCLFWVSYVPTIYCNPSTMLIKLNFITLQGSHTLPIHILHEIHYIKSAWEYVCAKLVVTVAVSSWSHYHFRAQSSITRITTIENAVSS